jgi:hypothetical protein
LSEGAYRRLFAAGVKDFMARRKKRRSVSPAELFAILADAFDRERPDGCESCQIPLPYRIARPDAASANWEIGPAADCAHRCRARIAEIVTRLWSEYDLEEPMMHHRHDEGRRLH